MRPLAVVWVVWAACVPIQPDRPRPPPEPPRRPDLELSIASYVAPNGLRVVLVKDPRAPEIQVTMQYRVGSVDDPPDRTGMAHLVEHLMYQTTADGESLYARLEASTTYFNGMTSFDATTYVERALPEHLDELLAIETARVASRCGAITPSGFLREREVVINEIRERDQTSTALAAIHQALYVGNHPYRRGVGGTPATVGTITRAEACAFADAHYAPNNAALVVAGNFTPAQEHDILYKFVAAASRREVVAPVPVHADPFVPSYVAAPVPFDDDALLVVWPLPPDPRSQAKARALVASIATLVDNEIDGSAVTLELGDTRAPLLGFIAMPQHGEGLPRVRDGIGRAMARLPAVLDGSDPNGLGDLAFTRVRETSIYHLYASLEDTDRDVRLAGIVLAGGDPRTELGDELAGLQELTGAEAAYLARAMFTLPRAKVVVLQATAAAARHEARATVSLGAAIHDLGQARRAPALVEAHQPAIGLPKYGVTGMTWRVLRNGMHVVLLPSASVPTIELRLVFATGEADEPADQRGVATLAAHALDWDTRAPSDLLAFAAAGGTKHADVDSDATAFVTHGLDMYLDRLLAGLRTWVLAGVYDDGVDRTLAALARDRARGGDDAKLVDAWRAGLYGDRHPYARAGIARHASAKLDAAAAARFRAAHYTPDNATLVITGRFDPAVADPWIDYLFGAWQGRGLPRVAGRSTPHPVALGKIDELAQVHVQLALPAIAGTRAEQLVAAEMLAAIAGDVRHQLGASYDLSAGLVDQRLSTHYAIAGSIDAPRTAAAVQLLRERIAALRVDSDATARAFVIARAHVATHASSLAASAETLAARIAHDIALDRAPMSDPRTAIDVENLTVDRMAAVFADLDLARASIAMQGPSAELQRAFAALGRTPLLVP